MNKKITILSVLAALTTGVAAQSLTPKSQYVDCGQIIYQNPSSVKLTLKNTSKSATSIKSVDTGCGCSRAAFSRATVAPGQSIIVDLTFDAKQLGHFERVVRVYDANSEQPAEINVAGQVVSKIVDYQGEYPYHMGVLATDINELEFNDVYAGQRFVHEIHIQNLGSANAEPTALRMPPYLKATMQPSVLGPKQKGTMFITLNASDLRDFGLTQTSFYLGKDPSDKINDDKKIEMSAILLPPPMAKDDVQRPYAAKMQISAEELDMTLLQKKSKVKEEITISNAGRSDLEITKVQLFTAGLEVELDNSLIKPGESTKLKVTGIAKALKKVKTRPRILLVTNDPDRAKVVISIKR